MTAVDKKLQTVWYLKFFLLILTALVRHSRAPGYSVRNSSNSMGSHPG